MSQTIAPVARSISYDCQPTLKPGRDYYRTEFQLPKYQGLFVEAYRNPSQTKYEGTAHNICGLSSELKRSAFRDFVFSIYGVPASMLALGDAESKFVSIGRVSLPSHPAFL